MKRIFLAVIVSPLFMLMVHAQQKPVPYGNNPAAGRYYDVRGIKMYCEVYGKGKPLLLIHGNGGDISAFYKNIPYFSKKYMVIAVDSRAHGKSTDPRDSLTFEMMADDFAGLLDAMHIDSSYVIGWSDGGINALLLAMRHPDKSDQAGGNRSQPMARFYRFCARCLAGRVEGLQCRQKQATHNGKRKKRLENIYARLAATQHPACGPETD